MRFLHLLAASVLIVAKKWGNVVKYEDVNKWIKQHGNPNDYGGGYSGNSLSIGPSKAFAEIRRDNVFGWDEVTASVYLNPRYGAVATKTWKAKGIDHRLNKMFGLNNRFRIDL